MGIRRINVHVLTTRRTRVLNVLTLLYATVFKVCHVELIDVGIVDVGVIVEIPSYVAFVFEGKVSGIVTLDVMPDAMVFALMVQRTGS